MAPALPSPRAGDCHVAGAAQQAIVLEAALAAAVGHRDDVIGLPPGPRGAPGLPCRAVGRRRLRPRPLAVGLHHVEAAQPARPFVTLLDLAADVPRAAANLPLVDAGAAAERPARPRHQPAAPAADRPARRVQDRLPPFVGRDDAGPFRAHEQMYRLSNPESLITNPRIPHPGNPSNPGESVQSG
jgi:hypothetical protein